MTHKATQPRRRTRSGDRQALVNEAARLMRRYGYPPGLCISKAASALEDRGRGNYWDTLDRLSDLAYHRLKIAVIREGVHGVDETPSPDEDRAPEGRE